MDLITVRETRVARTRDVIQDQPLKTTAYAVGLGVLIGMLLRR